MIRRTLTRVATSALLLAPLCVVADVTAAYARSTNNGNADSYIIVTQRGDAVLVTFNVLKMTQPGLFGGTQRTNIFSYGIGTLDPATMTARVTMSSFTEGSCYSVLDLRFAGNVLTKTGVGGTCIPATSAAETFLLAF